MIQLLIMKHKISILSVLATLVYISGANASECIDSECDLLPAVITELETAEPDTLRPETPEIILWSADASESQSCEPDYNCPFDTAAECDVWYKKPVHNETVVPRAPHLASMRVDDMLYEIYSNPKYCANDSVFEPLVARYNMLMRASHACCNAGIVYKMRQNKINDKKIYEFLKDDANYFAITHRCLVTPNDEILSTYSNGVDGEMVSDVRNSCLCKNREWFESLLTPFTDMYYRAPKFKENSFEYTYIDGMNREVSVSINSDVDNILEMLSACPK